MLLSLEAGIQRTVERRGIRLDWADETDVRPDFLAEAVAKWWINEGSLDELPKIAAEVSVCKDDIVKSISEANGADAERMTQLIGDFMRQRGYTEDYKGGVTLFCDLYVRRIARGEVHPYVGAACLAWAGLHAAAAPSDAIRVFQGLVSKWDSEPMNRTFLEEEILSEARRRIESR